jgi:3-deoxy-manno-octulosonate cytidylyltransferase (CMP-KDO synthetase)
VGAREATVATKRPTVVGVIPARYASSRFPGKACLGRLYVATDDQRIFDAAKTFTDDVVMTAAEHPSGTDRVAEVAAQTAGDVYVNIQGDEPLIEAAAVDAVAGPFDDEGVQMATLARPFPPSAAAELASANVCKIVVDRNGDALYFTRAMVPFRYRPQINLPYLRHVGIYAYRRDFLLRFTTLEPTPLEATEGLEMLRALAHGFKVRVVVGDFTSGGVDTPQDLAAVVEHYLKLGEEDAAA